MTIMITESLTHKQWRACLASSRHQPLYANQKQQDIPIKLPAERRIDVLYIASHSRSGSTLVGSVLGLVEGYVYLGEIREVWRDGLIDNQSCGCGQKFRDCPFWTEVFQKAFGGFKTPEVTEAGKRINAMAQLPQTFDFLRLAWTFPRGHGAPAALTDPLAALYAAIRDVSKAEVIVDSSKTMRYAGLLAATPGIDFRMLNLIRDPRAIVQSRAGQARYRDGSLKPIAAGYGRYRVVRILAKWALRNWLAGRVVARDGGSRLLYEDFVNDQRPALAAIAGTEKAAAAIALLARGVAPDFVQHQIAGNWVRGLRIETTESWREKLPWFPRVVTGILSAPLRWRYRSSPGA